MAGMFLFYTLAKSSCHLSEFGNAWSLQTPALYCKSPCPQDLTK